MPPLLLIPYYYVRVTLRLHCCHYCCHITVEAVAAGLPLLLLVIAVAGGCAVGCRCCVLLLFAGIDIPVAVDMLPLMHMVGIIRSFNRLTPAFHYYALFTYVRDYVLPCRSVVIAFIDDHILLPIHYVH